MAKKKSSIAAASVASSSSSRRPPETDFSAEGSAQALKNLNIRLTGETAELQKEVKRLTSKLALAGTSRCTADGRGRGGVARSSRVSYTASAMTGIRKTAENEASVEMGVTPASAEPKQRSELTCIFAGAASNSSGCAANLPLGKENLETATTPVGAEQKQSNTCCSEPVSVFSRDCVVDMVEPESFRETAEQEPHGIHLPSIPALTSAGLAVDHALVEADLAATMNQTPMKMAECTEETGAEKIMEEKNDERTEEVGFEKQMEEKLKRMEEGMKIHTEEISWLKKRMEEMDSKANMAAEKKSKWGVFKWIVPTGILLGVTCALYAKSK